MRKIFTLLSVAALPVLATAQSQRVVMVEHFTQASCGPCATYNPAFNALINNNPGTVVTIKYQTSWPGVDPMNAQNPTEVASRVSYYGINSVPRAVIDGNVYNGNPGNVGQSHFTNRAAVSSPYTVNVAHNITPGGDSIRVQTIVKKTDSVAANATVKLHVGVIERNIWFPVAPGSNGEKHFQSVMKKLLPNASGTTLSAMAIGDSAVYEYTWKLANIYDMRQLAAVAFVQNNSTKEVYQAGYAAPNFDLNLNMSSLDNKKAKIAGLNGNGTFNMKFKAGYSTAGVYRLRLNKSDLPTDWSAEFSMGGTTYADSADVNMGVSDSVEVEVKIMTGNTPYQKGTVTLEGFLTSNFPNYKAVGSVTGITTIRTAFINKGTSTASNTSVLNALNAAGTNTMQLTKEEFEGLDATGLTKDNVDHIFINTSTLYSGTLLTNTEITNLTNYLNSGGNLFIAGQDVGFSAFQGGGSTAYKNFFTNFLGADYLNDGDDDGLSLSTVAGEPLFGNMGSTTLNTSAYGLYSDVVAASPMAPNATAIINYDNLNIQGYAPTTGVAAVSNYGSDWKTVYVAFLPEAISSSTFRNQLMDVSVDWFDGLISSIEYNDLISNSSAIKAYPNPANAKVTVEITDANGASVINVVDMLGRVVLTQNIGNANNPIEISTASLDAGTYFLQVEGGAKVATQKLVIVK